MRQIGDECYICPSCGGGTTVVNHAEVRYPMAVRNNHLRLMDLVKCTKCGCVFAVDDESIPEPE